MVLGDEVKLREVLQNLIGNALQHARSRWWCGPEVAPAGRRAARVLVQDDGPGLPESQVHLVFDRTARIGGVGLGLAICKEFVELHGGEIWAESPADGGCWFIFTVRWCGGDEAEERGAGPPPARARSTSGCWWWRTNRRSPRCWRRS